MRRENWAGSILHFFPYPLISLKVLVRGWSKETTVSSTEKYEWSNTSSSWSSCSSSWTITQSKNFWRKWRYNGLTWKDEKKAHISIWTKRKNSSHSGAVTLPGYKKCVFSRVLAPHSMELFKVDAFSSVSCWLRADGYLHKLVLEGIIVLNAQHINKQDLWC